MSTFVRRIALAAKEASVTSRRGGSSMKQYLFGVLLALALAVTVGGGASAATADVDCPQTKAVFYTTDTQNLARALGANKSDCADYYISISRRPGRAFPAAARRLRLCMRRVLGSTRSPSCSPRIHSGLRTRRLNGWYATGVMLHDAMLAAGYDPAAGDTWARERGRQPLRFDCEHGRLQRRGRCASQLPRLHSGSLHGLGRPDDAGDSSSRRTRRSERPMSGTTRRSSRAGMRTHRSGRTCSGT